MNGPEAEHVKDIIPPDKASSLEATVRSEARKKRRAQVKWFALAIIVVAYFAYSQFTIRGIATELNECITASEPGDPHECFERGQEQGARFVGELARVTLANRLVVLCVLDVDPLKRTEATEARCEAEAEAQARKEIPLP